ncbi:hypothetical protein PITCH_A1910060 [uncultured Desulfobacterium sp.]|uniref:Uncharacterized protein n=1 Tax=uncultured Desulfobacterium sp. TaxID=201089 RepID=A0A445MVU6_9BACT|nr:hypothetical protein PITCH_A1910060 [uncultured Desulfobacterium sp.]
MNARTIIDWGGQKILRVDKSPEFATPQEVRERAGRGGGSF